MLEKKGLVFHHIGVPVPKSRLGPKARYSSLFKMYSENCCNELGIRIEYHAFEEGSSLDARIKNNIHIAFKVKNIDQALRGQTIIMPLYEPFRGYRCAMILVNDVCVELLETALNEEELWSEGSAALKNGILYPKTN